MTTDNRLLGPERVRLDSWKEIAQYLGRDVRTVLRWEHERGLPVHTIPSGHRRSVFAYKDELDVWLAHGQGDQEVPHGVPSHRASAFLPRVRVSLLRSPSRMVVWLALGLGAVASWLVLYSFRSETESRNPAISGRQTQVNPANTASQKSAGFPSPSRDLRIPIRAYIDGRSRLVMRGNRVWWYHLDFAAPGRSDCKRLPTIISGMEWHPAWPDSRTCENMFCDCASDFFRINLRLPDHFEKARLETVRARDRVSILATPETPKNVDWIIEFDDNKSVAADWYEITLVITPESQGATVGAPD